MNKCLKKYDGLKSLLQEFFLISEGVSICLCITFCLSLTVEVELEAGVSIIFKIRVFYKARFEGFEFSIRWALCIFS